MQKAIFFIIDKQLSEYRFRFSILSTEKRFHTFIICLKYLFVNSTNLSIFYFAGEQKEKVLLIIRKSRFKLSFIKSIFYTSLTIKQH